jgi:hypothetical protein
MPQPAQGPLPREQNLMWGEHGSMQREHAAMR